MLRLYRRLLFGLGLLVCLPLASAASSPELSPGVHDLIERFFATPDFERLQLAPSGSHVLFEKEIDGRRVMGTMDCTTGRQLYTAPAKGYVLNTHWVGNDQILFERIEEKKVSDNQGQATQLAKSSTVRYYNGHWLIDKDFTKERLFPSTFEHILVVVDVHPNRALLTEQWEDKFYSALYAYDPSKNTVKVLDSNPGHVTGWETDAAGHVRLARVAEPHEGHSFLYRETEQAKWRPLMLPAKAEIVTFDPSGRFVLISFPDKDHRYVMQSFDLGTGQLTDEPLSDSVYDVIPDTIRDPRSGSVCGLAYHREKPKFIWFDPGFKQLQVQLAATFPDAVIEPIGATSAGGVLISTQSDVSPPQYFVFTLQTGKLRRFLDPEPKVRGLTLSPMQPITFKAADGTDIHGYLTLPAGRKASTPPPLIAISHGGPSVRDTWGYDPEVQYFASLGYAVLQVNYRGSTGYGSAYAMPSIIAVGHQSVDDVADGVRWAIAEGHADARRIVVYGASYGGYISLGLATRYPELPTCVVGFAGVYDWEFDRRAIDDKFREVFRWNEDYWPDLKSNAAAYHTISPVHQAGNVRAPVLLLHGQEDSRVDVSQSEMMARALRKAGKQVELFRDNEGVHGLPDAKLRQMFYERVTAFILKYAPPDRLP